MGEDTVSIPILKQVADLFRAEPVKAATLEVEPKVVEPEDYSALKTQVETLEAEKAERLEADAKAERLTAIRSEFDTEEYGTAYIELGKAEESVEMLSKMDEDVRLWVMTNFRALSKQIAEGKLTEELGVKGSGDTSGESLNDKVTKYMAAHDGLNYAQAVQAMAAETPELFKAYGGDV